jgi:hypothetical protein
MFERCLNPDCGLPFDYREGRLVRVSSKDPKSSAEPPRIEHLWLCGKCSERYVFPHERGAGMKIRVRVGESQETAVRNSAATVKPWERAGYHQAGAIVAQEISS